MNEIIKKFLDMLRKTESQDSQAKMIAKHLAGNYLYEREGVDTLYPDLADKVNLLQHRMSELGMPVKVFEAFRSAKKQDEYHSVGRKTEMSRQPITNSKGLQSYHQYGLAVDIIFEDYNWNPPSNKWWRILGEEGKKLGLEWGGDWKGYKDCPHFEWHPRFSWELLEPYFKDVI